MVRWIVGLVVIAGLAGLAAGCGKKSGAGLGNVACWGNGMRGELGSAHVSSDNTGAVAIAGFDGATSLVITDAATCARTPSGMKCTGDLAGVVPSSTSPMPITALGDVAELAIFGRTGCVRRSTGVVECWGNNLVGQLGNGAAPDPHTKVPIKIEADSVSTPKVRGGESDVAVAVTGLTDATRLSVGGSHACAIRKAGTIVCWGLDSEGQLGDGRKGYGLTSDHPVEVVGVTGATAIASGTLVSCAIAAGGVWCWGRLGDPYAPEPKPPGWDTPTKIAGVGATVELAIDEAEACARSESGTISCWSVGKAPVARDVGHAVQLVAGERHACARNDHGEVRCWGDNLNGQLGVESTSSQYTPVPGLGPVVDLGAGGAHTCVLMKST